LLIAYKFASPSEWRRHISKLEEWGYPYLPQLTKELAREKTDKSAGGKSGRVEREAPLALQTSAELEGEVSEVGDDLLAGGA
jgi:hypothetical protein